MVRETRHLWVGNLPDNIREDRIREHFKRYGRVQNVKLLGRMENASANASGGANSGVCATVAFMDIKSASKAHNVEHVLDERTLTTEYYEPAAIPSSAGAPSAGSSPAGSGYSGSSSSVNSAPAPVSTSRYHLSGEESAGNACAMAASAAAPATWRGTNDSATDYCRRGNTPAAYGRYQRNNSTAPYATPPSNTERTAGHARWYPGGAGSGGAAGGESAPSTPGGGGGGGGERRRRASGSGSSRSRSDSSSPEPSDTSRASTPHAPPPPHNRPTPPSHPHQWPSTANGRPLAICVRNLPTRSTDSSLKDGLYHEYKKHGKVVWVKVVGQNADRYAVVRFKKPSDVDKALEVSQDKLFFGCKISVAPHQSCDDDAESAKPYETDIDEYHPKATRTLFIGNLEKDVTQQQLRDKFKHFGRIIEIDIKKGSGGGAGYAFCQYASISSVVEAIRAMDGEYVGSSRVKLGFGKPVATTCVWVDGLTEHTEKQVLGAVSRCGSATSVCVDRAAGAALVHFEQAAAAGGAVRELRRVAAMLSAAEPDHPRLCVDYASRECQEAFYEQLEKHGGSSALAGGERMASELSGRYLPTPRHDTLRYDATGPRSRAPSFGRSTSRTPRYTHDVYDPAEYAADRRYRVYDELGSSPQTDDANYEDRLQSVVVSPHRAHKHRRDSSPEERKLSKERHRSAGAGSRRSRSGSRSEKHVSRRRHRRRRDGSESRGSRASRAGTPLRDEVDVAGAPPTEPRRPPRERPPLPMSLPLPKFAVQLLRAAPSVPRVVPPPAPASPPRPPSASSSSGGSAPHSPSLEERIRSLDEKYERWTGSRAHMDAPDRARLRHRLLELDINEVKPSEVVRSLLAKRSVFDEDSERLEVATRAPSPSGSPRSLASVVPRTLRYPFPSHTTQVPQTVHTPPLPDSDEPERTVDPRLNRPSPIEKTKSLDSDNTYQSRLRLRTPSTDKTFHESVERKTSPTDKDRPELVKEERKRRNSILMLSDEFKTNLPVEKLQQEKSLSDKQFENSVLMELQDKCYSSDSFSCLEEKTSAEKGDNRTEKITVTNPNHVVNSLETFVSSEEEKAKNQDVKMQLVKEDASTNIKTLSDKFLTKNDFKVNDKSETKLDDIKPKLDTEPKSNEIISWKRKESDRKEKNSISNFHKDSHPSNLFNSLNSIELRKCTTDSKAIDSVNKDKCELNKTPNLNIEGNESHTFEANKCLDKLKQSNVFFPFEKRLSEIDKTVDEILKADRERHKSSKDKPERDSDKEKGRNKTIKVEKNEKDKKVKDEPGSHRNNGDKIGKIKSEKLDKDDDKLPDKEKEFRHEEKSARHENHKKDKSEKEKRKEGVFELDISQSKIKKEDRFKHERTKRESSDSKRDSKKDIETKSRKSSRDESSRDIGRKDSTDSSASRASQDSTRAKESESDVKEDTKSKVKLEIVKLENEKNFKLFDTKIESKVKVKNEIKEEKEGRDHGSKTKTDNSHELNKNRDTDKQRHYSLDSPSTESKRKERLNSCSSLPVSIGNKRRMSSHESIDYNIGDESKKCRSDVKHERRDSKDSRNSERPKSTKFSKGHFAKIIESKTKDDKKNQVKPPDEVFSEIKDVDEKDGLLDKNKTKRNHQEDMKDAVMENKNTISDTLQNNFDFLATLELRSSEEDERQKALRKEMKEKKRIQQLQQIQELQQQADALQQSEQMNKMKDDKKYKTDDKKKEAMREKRMSTERKSKDEKSDSIRRKSRKATNSTDTSDSDEPKKHSIFDIIDDEPTYTMYDKVKARSCKNMQKQEEEKRQEKIKAKFSQLKQSRAKREEKKRSSWDEDSDSDHDRSKTHKFSMDSSSDDEGSITQNKKREKRLSSSFDYDHSRDNDFFNSTSNDEDIQNKLTRKNSRTRIISDTSDDDMSTGKTNGPDYINNIKKKSSNLLKYNDSNILLKNSCEDKIKKTSLLNLFGKSDSEDNRQKLSLDIHSDFRMSYNKSFTNDFSSESESNPMNRIHSEMRRKHKKKQRKYKFLLSDDDAKHETNNIDSNKEIEFDIESKYKNSDKTRRHNSKKEKRKEKIRDSFDNEREEQRDENNKIQDKKRSPYQTSDSLAEITPNSIKKEGRMEDIFGPLSDESDRDSNMTHVNKTENNISEFETKGTPNSGKVDVLDCDENRHHKDESNRRKKEKKRKEKKHFATKEDENSLDVDAVSKAIEARLFADTSNTDDNRIKFETIADNLPKQDQNEFQNNIKVGSELDMQSHKHAERLKKDSRDRKKKKKRSREDKRSRKNHHHFYHHEKTDKIDNIENVELSPKRLLDIPLPTDVQKHDNLEKSDDSKSLSESPSLPRITDSPTFATQLDDTSESKTNDDMTPKRLVVDDRIEVDYHVNETIEVDEIPMPPPIENIVQDISEVPLPKDPPINAEGCQSIITNITTDYDMNKSEVDSNEDAVRSICNLDEDPEKQKASSESPLTKQDKKVEEKPRAVISQEETEDAVAALLGESFGGNDNTFTNYEKVEVDTVHQAEIECTVVENEIIPEEDAEEMRQAVQNLNACEMEMKPDTPVSDNDLLLIDTDTEENEENTQDAIERLPVNIIATNQSLNNNTKTSIALPSESTNVVVAKPQILEKSIHPVETNVETKNDKDSSLKTQVVKKDAVDQATSTATPVITSWTLSNKKLMEPRVINISTPHVPSAEVESKTTHITASIVQVKSPQNQTVKINNTIRSTLNQSRLSAPYQVINQVIRPQVSTMQPPTIKIPESHVIYQKPQAIVISPRLAGNDPRLQSPKLSPQADGMTSPRLTNMAIINTNSPQNINSIGLSSPPAVQQRSPGQVTVVRMQQPPLSPIHTMHLPPGARAMVSPNRPNSVLVQTQGAPIHLNRLPVTPVLAPITKHMGNNNLIQTVPKSSVNTSPIIHQQKVITGECRKPDIMADNTKIILSPTRPQNNTITNPTILAQNRLISMQNALNVGNLNSTLHLTNKVLVNSKNLLAEKRESQFYKSEHNNLPSFVPNSILQVANVSHSNTSIIQGGTKPVMCNTQDSGQLSRGQVSNVIHSINSQRLVTSSPISNVLQLETNKGPSVLSIAPVRSTSILSKSENSTPPITTSSLTNVVMTPLLLKTNTSPKATIRLHPRSEGEIIENKVSVPLHCNQNDSAIRLEPKNLSKNIEIKNPIPKSPEHIITPTKCETDFEELLKDNTNEIKVISDPNKKLEINVGKSVTTVTQNISKKLDDKNIEEKELVPPQETNEKLSVIKSDNLQSEIKMSNDTELHNTAKEMKSEDKLPQKVEEDKNEIAGPSVTDPITVNPNVTKKEDNNELKNHINESSDKETQGKKIDNYFWSANDVNIESVIKKVDSLCNETQEDKKPDTKISSEHPKDSETTNDDMKALEQKSAEEIKEINESKEEIEPTKKEEPLHNEHNFDDPTNEKAITTSKRGGRNSRGGKRTEKNQDRVQARKITKPARGTNASKRGRGRCKVDKKTKSLVNSGPNNIPGDVYDFHEDSGDETSTSPNKNETRPRLILTIKSPLSGNSGATPTSTLSITPKDQNIKVDKPKEEKSETFASPSTNTRKSRRLQEKDIQRTTVDDVIDDVIKNSTMMCKSNKELNKKRPTRQASNKLNTDKNVSNDTRKSPRGTKRPRNRSLSDASMDSNEEAFKKDDTCSEPKIIKVSEPLPKVVPPEPEQQVVKPTNIAPPVTSCPPVNPTPIMKPPKKMISEISAKLAGTFDTPSNITPKVGGTSPTVPERLGQFMPERLEVEKHNLTRDIRSMDQSTPVEHLPAATGEVVAAGISADATLGRRLVDNVPTNMTPVGATEATDARVQSPALPHRPPSTHRVTDRATPILIRGGDSDAGSTGLGTAGAAGAGLGASRGFRGAYPGPASLPRGAHHPAHAPPKQIPPIGAHHPPASRVTLTSVPAISPQGQMPLGDGMYAHFSHQHYQMYQQHFRATQHENRATPTHFTRTLEAEGSEAPTSPLELRRPPSARVPRPAHSPAPADRHNIMYGVRCGRSPPPAHGTSRPPAALPPAAPGPPHASQVPREADSLQMLLRRYPVMWQGLLALKNDSAAVQMHFVGGNPGVAADALSRNSDGSPASLLRIAQRMRLEPAQLDQVHRKMKLELEHCILLALPCGRDHMDVLQQSTNLSAGFITYLQRKMAAGIVNVAPTPGHQQSMYTVHIFPSCDFANENLTRIAPDLMHRVANIAHLLIVIATAIA